MKLLSSQQKLIKKITSLFLKGAPAILIYGKRGSGKSTVLSHYAPAGCCIIKIQCVRKESILALIEAAQHLVHHCPYQLSTQISNWEFINNALPHALREQFQIYIHQLQPRETRPLNNWTTQKKKETLYLIQQILLLFAMKFDIVWQVDDIDQADPLIFDFFNQLHDLSESNIKVLFTSESQWHAGSNQAITTLLYSNLNIKINTLSKNEGFALLSQLKPTHTPEAQALIIEMATGNPSKIISLAALSINPSLPTFHKESHNRLIAHHNKNANHKQTELIALIVCLKEPCSFKTLANLSGQIIEEIKTTVYEVEKKAILTVEKNLIKIAHRHIQQKYYKLMNQAKREQIHIACADYFLGTKGRSLWTAIKHINWSNQYLLFQKKYPKLAGYYYDCANNLIEAKRIREASICYTQRMAHSKSLAEKWRLDIKIATCSMLLGAYPEASLRLETVIQQTKIIKAYQRLFIEASLLLCKLYSLQSLHIKAVDSGIAALDSMGINLSKSIDAQTEHYKNYNEERLKNNALSTLISRKKDRKKETYAAPQLINTMLSSAYIVNPKLYELLINYGLYDCFFYGFLPEHQSLLMHYTVGLQKNRDYLLAKHIADFALSLDNESHVEIKLEAHAVYYLTIMFWTQPYEESDAFAKRLKQLLLRPIQNEYWFHIMTNEVYIKHLQQKPLMETSRLLSDYIALTATHKIKFSTEMLLDLQESIAHFDFTEGSYRNSTQNSPLSNPVTSVFSQLCRCEHNIHFNEIKQANEKLLFIRPLREYVESTPPSILYPFYLCVIYYQPLNIDITGSWAADEINEALLHLKQLAHLCPDNFKHRYLIALSLKQYHQEKIALATHTLNQAVEQASRFRFLRDTALCYRFKALIEKNNIQHNMQQAITYYERAGMKLTLSTLYDLTFNNHERSNQAAHPPLLYDSKSQPVHAATKAYIIDINSASIAHQLAQPLTAITAQIETLLIQKKQQKEEESTVAILERAKHSLLEMGELIHRLKNQTKTQENILSHAFLSQRLKKIIKLYEADLVTFTLTIEPALKKHPLALDWLYFEQCLVILINNSLEACGPEERAHVFIQCDYQDRYLHIICHDQGPGIPEAIRPLLFKTPYTSKEKGMGIGLSLAKMMLQKAKGNITLINKSPGAHFHIKMPTDLRE